MPKVKVNDIEIYYETHGEGPKLLYISGTGGDLRQKPNVFDSPLAERFKILAFDQRGMGQTDKPDKPYTMADYADDASKLMEIQAWSSANVMGVSFGGMVAQEFALIYPEKIEKLVLACTSSGGKGGSSFPLHEYSDWSHEDRARLFIGVIDKRYDEEWKKSNPDEFDEMVTRWVKMMRFGEDDPERQLGAKRQLEARKAHDTYNRLQSLRVPVFIVGGRYDGVAPPENLQVLHELIPDSKIELFEGGHSFLGQDPRAYERIIEYILE